MDKSPGGPNHRNLNVTVVKVNKFIFNSMVKNTKVYELKISDEDELSGIDSISLVDEPAIEINWVAFNKQKPQEFHIPDGEDDKYIEKLMSLSQDEQELFDEGWVVDKIEIVGDMDFYSTDPNGPSIEDEKQYNVRYKYILNPRISGQSAVIPTTRDFCKTLIAQNRVWRVEDMENTRNDFGDSAMVWRGGFNCRHVWSRILYKKDATIINKASVNKGKVDVGGFPSGLAPDTRVLGYDQPDTVTSATLANPSPSTVRNLGLSKVYAFVAQKVSIDYDDTLSTDRGKELAKKLLQEGKDVSIITRRQADQLEAVYKAADELGIPHDKVHATNGALKWETIKKLGIEKHIDNNSNELKAINENLPNVETEKFGYDVGGIGGYVDPGVTGKTGNTISKSLVKPTTYGKDYFQTIDEEKRIVVGPAMVPDLRIFRKDSKGNPYYVYFSAETIKMIAEKYMRNKYIDNNDQMHDGKAVKDVYVIESWIKESAEDKSSMYGFGDMPINTWFVSMKVKNPAIWDKVKSGQLNGFSVSGYFEEVAAFCREEMFLQQVAEILSKIEE